MKKEILKTSEMLCLCCMEGHEVQMVRVLDHNVYKQIEVEYPAEYFYCDRADEFYADESMLKNNDIAMKDAYRKKTGLLTSKEISAIRKRYEISQSDFCLLLGWGGKTITRYETYQVQDMAHDTILRKVSDDPEWFLSLLDKSKGAIAKNSYKKYFKIASFLFNREQEYYLRKAILAKYAKFQEESDLNGNKKLSLDIVKDVICYFSNAGGMKNLYKVKLMKLLWYADAISYKRRGYSITGLVYRALQMGAVPVAHDSIIDLHGIEYEEIEMGEGTGYHFIKTNQMEYPYLSGEDIDLLDEVIKIFGKEKTDFIVNAMHEETAYKKTAPKEIISFELTKELSI